MSTIDLIWNEHRSTSMLPFADRALCVIPGYDKRRDGSVTAFGTRVFATAPQGTPAWSPPDW